MTILKTRQTRSATHSVGYQRFRRRMIFALMGFGILMPLASANGFDFWFVKRPFTFRQRLKHWPVCCSRRTSDDTGCAGSSAFGLRDPFSHEAYPLPAASEPMLVDTLNTENAKPRRLVDSHAVRLQQPPSLSPVDDVSPSQANAVGSQPLADKSMAKSTANMPADAHFQHGRMAGTASEPIQLALPYFARPVSDRR